MVLSKCGLKDAYLFPVITCMQMQIQRKSTQTVHVGNVPVGGMAPIAVQSMTNTPTQDVETTIAQIHRLEAAGCEIIRVAVPDEAAARAIRKIRQAISIPLIADIHFDHRLAIQALESGADGLRINPGNIGGKSKIRKVVEAAKNHNACIRVGVNAGSLEKDILKSCGSPTAEAMVESALRHIDLLRSMDFHQIKVSLKASDVKRTIAAYRLLSQQSDLPLHLGVTEAGGLFSGIVKSALGIGSLLLEGIGDTFRVSLTRDPVEEVRVAYEILRALDIRRRGPEIISCPTCGRCRIDLFRIAEEVEQALLTSTLDIKVAIMGCVVNGPGEAREADIGIAGGEGVGILFRKGRVVRKIPENQLVAQLLEEIRSFEKGKV
ncbi:flavodoxin-dependent (E)-4-hydroxy-3-methylbut-2-enyl-diphosphate synthase [Desulfatirhabdium butyrativorans]|uniref:flavodoxin-dependent (E)-4-hydroxy-3-methylbut-2-enyl-diphosphate synthase n=1 Tax=Desulfatirhabdium butyrativorans TaxID=340467 RepID=UPI0004205E54